MKVGCRRAVAMALCAVVALSVMGCADTADRSPKASIGNRHIADAQPEMPGSGALGAVSGNVWSIRMEQRRNALEAVARDAGIGLERTDDNQLKLDLPADAAFDSANALRAPFRAVLNAFAGGLKDDSAPRLLIVDDRDGLASERAGQVWRYLVARGVQASQIAVTLAAGASLAPREAANRTERTRRPNVEMLLREPAPA